MFRHFKMVLFSFSLASAAAFAVGPQKDWGLVVFLNGHNNLDSFGDGDVAEMLKAKDTSKMHVVVLHASMRYGKTRYRYVENGRATTLKEVPAVDMGDYKSLVEFSKWAMTEYPADKYMIDIWNHGAGWQKNSESEPFKNISSDDLFGSIITTEQIGVAMNEISTFLGRKVDILGMDACLMAMAEVAGEVQEHAKMMVAAQDLEPGDGWPYDDFLNGVATLDDLSPEAVSALLTKVYVASYTNGSQGSNSKVNLSSMNLEKMPRFEQAVKALTNELLVTAQADSALLKKFKDSVKLAQKFFQSDYVDFFDLVERLKKAQLLVNKSVIGDLDLAYKEFVNSNHFGTSLSKSRGVSIWVPTDFNYNNHAERYNKLKFALNSTWSEWLDKAYRTNRE
jgi:hypothetical protein